VSIYSPCKNGHSVRHRFTTNQGHVRCELCLQAARDRYAAKQRKKAPWPDRLGETFYAVAVALESVPQDWRGNVLRAAAHIHGVTL
jgi:hypothetical protein